MRKPTVVTPPTSHTTDLTWAALRHAGEPGEHHLDVISLAGVDRARTANSSRAWRRAQAHRQ